MTLLSTVRAAGLGELCVVQDEDALLTAQGLGSCIGIAAYEPRKKIAVMAHVMLPGPTSDAANAEQPARYATHAVIAVLEAITTRGGSTSGLVVKLAGGAQVIKIPGVEDRLKIGQRNIAAVHAALQKHNIRIAAEDIGGNVGRTLTLYAATGRTTVRVVGGIEQPL